MTDVVVVGGGVAGLDLDMAADSFATRTDAVSSLAIELGLGNDIVSPDPRGASPARSGRRIHHRQNLFRPKSNKLAKTARRAGLFRANAQSRVRAAIRANRSAPSGAGRREQG